MVQETQILIIAWTVTKEGACFIYVFSVCLRMVVCRRARVLLTLFVFVCVWWVGMLMSYLRYLCLFVYSGVQEGSCLIYIICACLCIVVCRRACYLRYLCLFEYSGVHIVLCFCFLCLRYPMFPVSLDCPFLIVPLGFFNVYLIS